MDTPCLLLLPPGPGSTLEPQHLLVSLHREDLLHTVQAFSFSISKMCPRHLSGAAKEQNHWNHGHSDATPEGWGSHGVLSGVSGGCPLYFGYSGQLEGCPGTRIWESYAQAPSGTEKMLLSDDNPFTSPGQGSVCTHHSTPFLNGKLSLLSVPQTGFPGHLGCC